MATQLLMGNEIFAHAALEAGVRVVAGYPGTPSSEVVETVAKLRAAGKAHGVHVEWSTNEKAALELLAAASYAGARTLFTCKQVGLNVASDALMSLNYVGVRGGCVLFVADDPGPISSQTEQDTRRFASFAKVPVLDPATPEQGFEMMKEAFALSERYQTPVIVRPTTRICHASTFMEVEAATFAKSVPDEGFEKDSARWVIFPKRSFEAHKEIEERLSQIAHDACSTDGIARFNPRFSSVQAVRPSAFSEEEAVRFASACKEDQARLGIVAGGVSAAYAREALRTIEHWADEAGRTVPAYRFMQVGTPYPFPARAVAAFSEGLETVLVLEELDYTLEDEMVKLAGRIHAPWNVIGKTTGDARMRGENDVDDCARTIARALQLEAFVHSQDEQCAPPQEDAICAQSFSDDEEGLAAGATSAVCPANFDLPARPPVLCAGCPHRGSFYAVKRALGKQPAVLCGDIGCYTLGNAAPLDAVDTCLCMGAGITMAQGLAVVEPNKKHIAFVGDSTFFASGLTGIANAAYNGHDITVIVLDNATTAMTGAQPHPGTGVTLMGEKRAPLSIRRVLEALGFECIVEADPLVVDDAVAAAKEAISFAGPSAVLYVSPCIQLTKPREAVSVDATLCTGCKRCITEIGCPGIGFDVLARGERSKDRGQAFVDSALCTGCGLCLQLCPTDALRRVQEEVG